MPFDHQFDDETERRIARYLAGECPDDEAAALRVWIAADPVRAAYVEELTRTWELAGELPPQWSSTAAWAAVRARIERRDRDERVVRELALVPPRFRLPAYSPLVRIAAALMLAVGAGSLWWAASRSTSSAPAPVPLRDVATRRGQRAELYLSDGTRVLLGVASRLRFAARLPAGSRDVYLDGEALFEVKHDPNWPFRVHTANAVTEDLGTRFNVRAYDRDSVVTVVVADGSVALAGRGPGNGGADARGSRLVLTRGDLGQLGADGRLRAERGVAVDRYLSWTEGRLTFENTPLRDVLPELARWYDLDFKLADSAVGALRLSASLDGEAPADAVRYIALTLDVQYEHQGRTVTFLPKSPTRR